MPQSIDADTRFCFQQPEYSQSDPIIDRNFHGRYSFITGKMDELPKSTHTPFAANKTSPPLNRCRGSKATPQSPIPHFSFTSQLAI